MFTTMLLHMCQIFSSLRGHLYFSVKFSLHFHGNFFLDDPLQILWEKYDSICCFILAWQSAYRRWSFWKVSCVASTTACPLSRWAPYLFRRYQVPRSTIFQSSIVVVDKLVESIHNNNNNNLSQVLHIIGTIELSNDTQEEVYEVKIKGYSKKVYFNVTSQRNAIFLHGVQHVAINTFLVFLNLAKFLPFLLYFWN